MCKKKRRLFNKAKKTGCLSEWRLFKEHHKATLKALNTAHWTHVNDILLEGL